MMDLLLAWQRWIYDGVRGALLVFSQSNDGWLLASILATGVLFGALHALTPGHGKALLASYAASSRQGIGQALLMSTALASMHVVTAVLIALFASTLVERSFVGGGRAPALELLSRSLLLGIGFWLVARSFYASNAPLPTHDRGQTKRGLTIALTAGLVPCPLTLFAMVAALSRGVPVAGVAFAGAMLTGIALTLGLVVLVAVLGRKTLMARLSGHDHAIAAVSRWLERFGGGLIIAIALAGLLH